MPIKLAMALIEVTGPDAVAFAQAQFSNDVASLADGHWQWNAWLSPQGRVRYFFHLLRHDAQHLRLLMRGGDPAALRDALKRFVLRSKVDVRSAETAHVVGFDRASDLPGDAPTGNSIAISADASVIALTADRYICISAQTFAATTDESGWILADIRDGIPTLARELEDAALPQWLGLDRLGAVSVKKGCYPGQEIMSRLHFKGGNKRGLYRLSIATATTPAPGSTVAAESGSAGQIVMAAAADAAHCDALAILSHASAERKLAIGAEPASRVEVLRHFV